MSGADADQIAAALPRRRLPRGPGNLRQGWRRLRRNRTGMLGLLLVVVVVVVAVLAPVIAPYAPNDQSAMLHFGAQAPPSGAHWFGTDRSGYDVLTPNAVRRADGAGGGAGGDAHRLVYRCGGRRHCGYLGGAADELLMRGTEFFLVIPVFIVILAVVRLFGVVVIGTPSGRRTVLNLGAIIVLLGLFGWPPLARLARAEFLRLKQMEFVEAARCIGARPRDIIFRHILPNALPSLVVVAALGIGGAILAEAMISFLGFGDPKTVSWGQSLYFNYQVLKVAPWAVLAPGLAIFLTVLGFNLLADGLSDAFNPRLKQ